MGWQSVAIMCSEHEKRNFGNNSTDRIRRSIEIVQPVKTPGVSGNKQQLQINCSPVSIATVNFQLMYLKS